MTQRILLPGTLVSTEWLAEHLGEPSLRIIDIRGYVHTTDLGEGKQHAEYVAAPDEYAEAHIPGAVFVDWTTDITDPDNPVKVQLAPPERFAEAMASRGIGDDNAIVVVDHTGGTHATRMWWALRAYGHDNVAVLDGGMAKWQAEGRPITSEPSKLERATFTPKLRPELRVEVDQVLQAINDDNVLIVDARDEGQYDGSIRRGLRGGHIPGAVHIPAKSLVNPDGTQKPVEEQAAILRAGGVTPEKRVIAYCNGGVTATALLFALDRTGHTNYANYDGSWNEWGEREDLPVETGQPTR